MKLNSILLCIKYLTIFNILKTVSSLTCPDGYVFYNNTNNCTECGLTFNTPNIKIVGGIPANPNSWPAQALIIQSYKGYHSIGGFTYLITVKYECGGTLINPFTILTAGHCISDTFDYNGYTYYMKFTGNSFYPSLKSTFTVYLGLHNASFLNYAGQTPPSPAVAYNLSNVIVHPNYDDTTFLNDIALLILSTEVKFTNAIQPACIPAYSVTYPTPNRTSYAAGWGTLSSGGSSPDVLYNVNLTVYSWSLCGNVYPTIAKNQNSQICAGEYSGGKDTCQGDSGGGLYIIDTFGSKQRYMVSGITSYGKGCAQAGYPGIYTRVSYYTNWIKSNWVESLITTTTKAATTATTPYYNTDYTTSKSGSNSALIAVAVIVPLIVLIICAIAIGCIICKLVNNKKARINNTPIPNTYQPYQPYQPHQPYQLPNMTSQSDVYQLPVIPESINSIPTYDAQIDLPPAYSDSISNVPTYQPKVTIENTQSEAEQPENSNSPDANFDYDAALQALPPDTTIIQNISYLPKETRAGKVFVYDNKTNSESQQAENNDLPSTHKIYPTDEITQNHTQTEQEGQNEVLNNNNANNNEDTPRKRSHKKKKKIKKRQTDSIAEETKYDQNDQLNHDDILKDIEKAIQNRKSNEFSET